MIELKLIPDGLAQVPAEAKDHGILAGLLEAASNIPDDAQAPIGSWRGVEREVPGHGEHVKLRVPGQISDYPGSSLDAITGAITNNISGLKEHPDGWQDVEEEV